MPTWFRCKNCFNKYYTAAPLEVAMIDDECEKCEGKLEPIYYEVASFLKRNLEVDFNFKHAGPARLSKGKIKSYSKKSINLVLSGNKFEEKFYDYRASCRVSFAREDHPAGRFYFDSEVLNFDQDIKLGLIISSPEYLVRKQERSAPRYPIKTDVKYRLADDIKSLLAGDQVEYNQGWTVDISKSGVLLMTDSNEIEEINEDKYVDLKIEYDRYNISTIGNVARINKLEKANDRVALGIKFLQQKSDNLDLIKELGTRKIIF
ncbi:MAG: PilZ domain-containing protein [Bacillota bacterium]